MGTNISPLIIGKAKNEIFLLPILKGISLAWFFQGRGILNLIQHTLRAFYLSS